MRADHTENIHAQQMSYNSPTTWPTTTFTTHGLHANNFQPYYRHCKDENMFPIFDEVIYIQRANARERGLAPV